MRRDIGGKTNKTKVIKMVRDDEDDDSSSYADPSLEDVH